MAIIDLTGQQIGRWTVLYMLEERTKRRGTLWHCRCECGNEKDVPGEVLRRNESRSCGCLLQEVRSTKFGGWNFMDLTGQRFGKLVALEPIRSKNWGHTKWVCKCDCGNTATVDIGNLRSGKSRSCGCTSSHQEEKIIKMLNDNGISYEYQYEFPNLPHKQFDFYINNQYIVEYDGEQHFKYGKSGWSSKDKLIRTHRNDVTKNQFCFDNNTPIIRIPYNKKYTFDDLMIEKTRFLVTPENEQDYYNIGDLTNLSVDKTDCPLKIPPKNKSGYPGVYWYEQDKIWDARIKIDTKLKLLGRYKRKDDAIKARMNAELEYYGRLKYQIEDEDVLQIYNDLIAQQND
jgi:hypothetical protein